MTITRSTQLAGIVAEVRNGRPVQVLDLVDGWARDVTRLAVEAKAQVAPSDDNRTVFDFIGTLHLRDRLESALAAIDGEVALPCVIAADELFRSFTELDESQKLHRGWSKVPVEPWWWHRLPAAGPIFEQLKAW